MIFSLVSRCFCFGNAYDFVFVTVCFFLLYALVFYVYCRVLPDVLSLMFFHVPPLGFLKWTTWLDLAVHGCCKLQALVYDILPSRRKVPESGARSVWLLLSVCSVSEQRQRHCAWPSCPYWRHWLGTHTKTRKGLKAHSSGVLWESRWPAWAVRPNEHHGFRGRKTTWYCQLCSRRHWSQLVPNMSTDIRGH